VQALPSSYWKIWVAFPEHVVPEKYVMTCQVPLVQATSKHRRRATGANIWFEMINKGEKKSGAQTRVTQATKTIAHQAKQVQATTGSQN
jgi:hypothetical protein